jgi:sporulation protein YlmC with PRC-barrel domain
MENPSEQNVKRSRIPALIAELGNTDGLKRQRARNKLTALGAPALPALISALSDSNDHIRWEAAKALGKMRASPAAETLVKSLEDENVDVRWAAAESLIRIRRKAVVPVLQMLVRNFDSIWLREGARYILRQLKKRGYLEQPEVKVLEALDGPVPEVQAPWAAKSALEAMQIDWEMDSLPLSGDKKMEIDIPIGAEVSCSDGPCGKIVCVILNPITDQVTHLVVQEQKLQQGEYLVPIEQVLKSSPTSVYLLCKTSDLKGMKPFIETEFIPNFSVGGSFPSLLWPYNAPTFGVILLEHEHIPQDELAVRRGARVVATDGEVGRVDEFLIDPDNGKITHLILREGHIWDPEDVTIPVSQIERIEENAVHLKLDKNAIEVLPKIPLRRRKQAK